MRYACCDSYITYKKNAYTKTHVLEILSWFATSIVVELILSAHNITKIGNVRKLCAIVNKKKTSEREKNKSIEKRFHVKWTPL